MDQGKLGQGSILAWQNIDQPSSFPLQTRTPHGCSTACPSWPLTFQSCPVPACLTCYQNSQALIERHLPLFTNARFPQKSATLVGDCWRLTLNQSKGLWENLAPWLPPLEVFESYIWEGLVFQGFYFLVLGHCNPGIKIGTISMLQIRLCISSFVPLPLIIPILVTHFLESWACFDC